MQHKAKSNKPDDGKGRVFGSEKINRKHLVFLSSTLPFWAQPENQKLRAVASVTVEHVFKKGSVSKEAFGVKSLVKRIHPVAGRAYLLQQGACAPAPTPGRLPAHQTREPGGPPRQTSPPPPAPPADTLYPSAQPAQLHPTTAYSVMHRATVPYCAAL